LVGKRLIWRSPRYAAPGRPIERDVPRRMFQNQFFGSAIWINLETDAVSPLLVDGWPSNRRDEREPPSLDRFHDLLDIGSKVDSLGVAEDLGPRSRFAACIFRTAIPSVRSRSWAWPAPTWSRRRPLQVRKPTPRARKRAPLTRISWRCGKTPTPTSPSSRKPNPNTPSCNSQISGIGSQPVCTPLSAGCAIGTEFVRRCMLDQGHSSIALASPARTGFLAMYPRIR